jgi:exonuclease V
MDGFRRSALERLGRKSIAIKDISLQFWCEKQMELYHTAKQRPTAAMERGTQIHEKMQKSIYVPLTVEPSNYSDWMYKVAYENCTSIKSLKEKGKCREVMIYGSINGYKLSGKIDQLSIVDGKVAIIEDKSTNKSSSINEAISRPHIVQIMLYRKFLEDIKDGRYSYDNFSTSYKLDTMALSDTFSLGLREIGIVDELLSIPSIYQRMFNEMRTLPELSSEMEIRYIDKTTLSEFYNMKVPYDMKTMDSYIKNAMGYWNGDREALPVSMSERWKCRMCRFYGKECKTWWNATVAQ